MADIRDTDQFLINRNDAAKPVYASNLMATIEDTDLMLVTRCDVTYTVTGADVKDSLGGGTPIDPTPDEITSVPPFQGGTGTELDPYILQPITVNPAGASGQSVEQITVAPTDASEYGLVIWADNSVGAGNRFEQPVGVVDASGQWVGRVLYLDTPDSTSTQDYVGNLQLGQTYFRWTVTQDITVPTPPDIQSVVLTENNPGTAPRFTDQTFDLAVTMTEDGVPASQKQIDAFIEGSIYTSITSDAITNVTVDSSNTSIATKLPDFNSGANRPSQIYGLAFDGNDKWMVLATYQGGTSMIRGTGEEEITWDVNYLKQPAGLGAQRGGSFYSVHNDKAGRWITFGQDFDAVGYGFLLISYSDDFGDTWTTATITNPAPVDAGSPQIQHYAVDTNYAGGWIAVGGDTANQYAYVSSDNGATWTRHVVVANNRQLVACARRGNICVAASDQSYFYSSDGGETWSTPVANPTTGGFTCVRVADDTGTFVGAHKTLGSNKLYYSQDNGVTFTPATTGGTTLAGLVSFGADNWQAVPEFGNNNKVFTSTDDGLTWPNSYYYGLDKIIPQEKAVITGAGSVAVNGIDTTYTDYYIVIGRGDRTILTVDGETNLSEFSVGQNVFNGIAEGDPANADGFINQIIPDGTNSQIVLTNVEGSWLVGQVVQTEPERIDNVKKYLIFDDNGNISDLSSTPQSPRYTTGDDPVNLTFTFPSTFPSGEAPDDEIIEGSDLGVSVIAANTEGVDSSEARVTPSSTTTTSAMGEAELAQQKLRFATYENRRDVYQGEQAMAQREALLKEVAEMGLDAAELLGVKAKAKRGRRKKTD